MTRRQLAYWFAFFDLEPPIADRLDVLLPALFAGLMNMWRAEDSPPILMSELAIDWAGDSPEPVEYTASVATAEETMAAGIMAAFGG